MGFRQGLVLSIFAAIGLVAGVALAGIISDGLVERLAPDAPSWVYVVCFAIVLIAVVVVCNMLGRAVKNSIKSIMLSWTDSVGGGLLGMFTGGLMVVAIFIALGNWVAGHPGETGLGTAIGESVLAHFFIDTFRFLLALLPGRFDAVRDFFD
ncbi:MAG: CvpA family protein [Dehalococcoidia bacterium]|nr:CvpA family protein [Dehalococcoidia bacterium]